jgi:hypothetical protein
MSKKRITEINSKILTKYHNTIEDIKIKYNTVKKIIKAELDETKYMLEIIMKKIVLGNASKEELDFVKKQGINITKLLSSGVIISLPGGIIIILTLQKLLNKYLKINIIPTTFLNKTVVDKINIEFDKETGIMKNIQILEETSVGVISPLFNIEKFIIHKFKYNDEIIKLSEEDVIEYHLDLDNDINDSLPVLRRYVTTYLKTTI